MTNKTSAGPVYWFEGHAAQPLLSYLQPMQSARRMAAADAAGELLAPLIDEACKSLLVLHPVRSLESLEAYALRMLNANCGWRISEYLDSPSGTGPKLKIQADPGALGRGFLFNLKPATNQEVAADFSQDLLSFWVAEIKGGKVGRLGSPPGLPTGAVLGVLESRAADLWPQLFDVVKSEPEVATMNRPRESVQPEGGSWPHKGGAWTEEERIALFLMRHRDKMTGKEMAAIVGQSRQRIDQVIGPVRPHGGPSYAVGKDNWKPSSELLKACSLPLQPLQNAAHALAT